MTASSKCSMTAAIHTNSLGKWTWPVHAVQPALCLPSHKASAITSILLPSPVKKRCRPSAVAAAPAQFSTTLDDAADTPSVMPSRFQLSSWDLVGKRHTLMTSFPTGHGHGIKSSLWTLPCYRFHFPLLRELCKHSQIKIGTGVLPLRGTEIWERRRTSCTSSCLQFQLACPTPHSGNYFSLALAMCRP